ncbi:hypothetical protein, partial [Klebsiella pneumoniae]|uniref:hypothetical protein n=1 Tax=Klebsiella pneumoniae TaxID=573 RepID=UPI00192F9141
HGRTPRTARSVTGRRAIVAASRRRFDPPMSLSRPLRLFLLLLPLLGGLLLSMDWAGRQARQQALRAEGEQVRKQLDLYAGSLQTLIERFRSLPAVLALDPD